MREVFKMMGVIFITALEMLHKSNFIGPALPLLNSLG